MFFSTILLSISLSMDALFAGICYGVKKIKIPFSSKLIICLCSSFYSALALVVGTKASQLINPGSARLIGIIMLFSLGILIILKSIFESKNSECTCQNSLSEAKTVFKVVLKSIGITIHIIKNPQDGDFDHSGKIDFKESLMLSLALSIDSIVASIGSALSGLTSWVIPIAIGTSQMILLYIGSTIGIKLNSSFVINKKFANIVPGLLLITLAFVQLLEK